MRRILALLVILCMTAGLCACRLNQQETPDTVNFYFLRKNIVYGADDGVIHAEERQVEGADLDALLAQYLNGPQSEELFSPFPAGTRLLTLSSSADSLTVVLSKEYEALEGMNYILACACLARTCFDLSDAAAVTIHITQTEQSITMTRESLTLYDDSDTIDATIGTEPLGY